jgi:uncharacterized protein YacL
MSKLASEAFEVMVIAVLFIVGLLLIPRLLNSISLNNTRIATQTSPQAAADSVFSSLINAGGNIGVGLINKYGESLLDTGE